MFGKKQQQEPEEPIVEDPTAWMINSGLAEFLLMHTNEIKYMAMLGYTYVHGSKLFPTFPTGAATSFKFVSMILRCTGGGILVPIFINKIPVPLAQDAYPVAILTSFLLHEYVPILRDVMKLSAILKTALIVLYEVMRASVVVKLTTAAAGAIAPSEFEDIAVFGPIFCGTIGGCGGAFLPLDKGLSPIQTTGLGQPMLSAFVAATCFHLFLNTSLSEGVIDAKPKAHLCMVVFFIVYNLYSTFGDKLFPKKEKTTMTKKPTSEVTDPKKLKKKQ